MKRFVLSVRNEIEKQKRGKQSENDQQKSYPIKNMKPRDLGKTKENWQTINQDNLKKYNAEDDTTQLYP